MQRVDHPDPQAANAQAIDDLENGASGLEGEFAGGSGARGFGIPDAAAQTLKRLFDGITFDAEGHLWVASMTSNRLFRVAPDGEQTLLLEDNDPEYLVVIERRLKEGTLRREDVQQVPSKRLKNIASVTFGGADLKTVYLGSLGGDRLAALRSPVAGEPLAHWTFLSSKSIP